MKKVVIKSTYPIWGLWFAFLFGCTCAAIYLFGGCGYSEYPVAPDRTVIQVNKQSPSIDSSLYYISTIIPIDSTRAIFNLRDGYGSEIATSVRIEGDSLVCDLNKFGVLKWAKCVWHGMEFCDYHDDISDYWECVGIYAAGCTIGRLYIGFVTMPLGWL